MFLGRRQITRHKIDKILPTLNFLIKEENKIIIFICKTKGKFKKYTQKTNCEEL